MPKILIVDDEASAVRLLTLTLAGDYDVLQASDGEQAVRIAETTAPGVMLLEINIPVLNGFEALRRVKQSNKTQKTRVIVVTGRSDEADKVFGMQLGADAYLTKPFSPSALVKTIGEMLGGE